MAAITKTRRLRAPEPVLMPAIWPSHALEVWYRRKLELIVGQMQRSVSYRLRAAWNKGPPVVIAQDYTIVIDGRPATPLELLALDAPSSVGLLQRALNRMSKHWQKKFDALAKELATKFADKSQDYIDLAMMDGFKKAGFTVRFVNTPVRQQAFDAVVAENVGLIKSIPRQYLRDVEQAVWQSVSAGRDLEQLTDTVQQKYGVAARRAQFIARDQNNKAKAAMERARRAQLGIKQAVWFHSTAGRKPRPEHVAFSGKTYTIAKGAYLEQKWVWPGTEPNCRCSDRAIIPGFDDD